jgi:hypothetical protein
VTNLVVVDRPGSELAHFGGLIQSRPADEWVVVSLGAPRSLTGDPRDRMCDFRDACEMLGARPVCVGLFHLHPDLVPVEVITSALAGFSHCDSVYTFSLQDDDEEKQLTAAAVGRVFADVFIATATGVPDQLVRCTQEQFDMKVRVANTFYMPEASAGLLPVSDLRGVETYTRMKGADLWQFYSDVVRLPVFDVVDQFSGCTSPHEEERGFVRVGLPTSALDPWNHETSNFEHTRYEAELDMLDAIPWETLVELGACIGTFTMRLARRFPTRRIIACEPNGTYFAKLQDRLQSESVEIIRSGFDHLPHPVDVVMASCCLYYAKPFPFDILETTANYFFFSHEERYQKGVVEPIMRSSGLELVREGIVAGRFEELYGILEFKEANVLQVWTRSVRQEGPVEAVRVDRAGASHIRPAPLRTSPV